MCPKHVPHISLSLYARPRYNFLAHVRARARGTVLAVDTLCPLWRVHVSRVENFQNEPSALLLRARSRQKSVFAFRALAMKISRLASRAHTRNDDLIGGEGEGGGEDAPVATRGLAEAFVRYIDR